MSGWADIAQWGDPVEREKAEMGGGCSGALGAREPIARLGKDIIVAAKGKGPLEEQTC